jgi:hypothetical protein
MNSPTRNAAPIPTKFRYAENVGSSHIRLLQVVHIDRQVLAFSLLRVPRDNAPRYTAVSYAWGNESPSEAINVDGQPFRVRPNLWSCLYYLGIASRHADWDYLWVDAICIDQENDAERNVQVSHMDQTYGNATCASV